MKMVEVGKDMMEDVKRPYQGMPAVEAEKQLAILWQDSPTWGDTWEDANLREVARYLMGAKGLQVPQRWEWILPTCL